MRLDISLSAVGLLVLLAHSEGEWRQLLERPVRVAAFGQSIGEAIDVGRCSSNARLVETVNTYDFYGSREADAAQSLRQRLIVTSDYSGQKKRFTGQAEWHIEWRPCFEARGNGCRIGGVASTVNVTYTLPRWADRDGAPGQLRGRWDRYMASLAEHEKGHGRIALEVAKIIEDELVGLGNTESCNAVNTDAARLVDLIMQRGEAMQREYDRATGHGSLQGAQFPF